MGLVHNTKKTMGTKSKFPKVEEEEKKPLFFSHFQLSNEILEDGDFYAEVSSIREDKDEPWKSQIKFLPFDDSSGKRIYYEPVYLTLDRTNTPSSPAGQFLSLFQEARHWGDVKDRVVGLEIKRNKGRDGRMFKNIVKVFETDIDELVFDDDHMTDPLTDVKTMADVIDTEEEEVDTPVASTRTRNPLDEDEEDLELEEEE